MTPFHRNKELLLTGSTFICILTRWEIFLLLSSFYMTKYKRAVWKGMWKAILPQPAFNLRQIPGEKCCQVHCKGPTQCEESGHNCIFRSPLCFFQTYSTCSIFCSPPSFCLLRIVWPVLAKGCSSLRDTHTYFCWQSSYVASKLKCLLLKDLFGALSVLPQHLEDLSVAEFLFIALMEKWHMWLQNR